MTQFQFGMYWSAFGQPVEQSDLDHRLDGGLGGNLTVALLLSVWLDAFREVVQNGQTFKLNIIHSWMFWLLRLKPRRWISVTMKREKDVAGLRRTQACGSSTI